MRFLQLIFSYILFLCVYCCASPWPTVPKGLKTKRLFLRVPSEKDAQEVFNAYASSEEVVKYLAWRAHKTIEDTRSYLRRRRNFWDENDGKHFWLVLERQTKKIIGAAGLYLRSFKDGKLKAEVGVVIGVSFWGKGYATELVSALADWALRQEMIGRVWGMCDIDNIGSAQVLAKTGFKQECIFRDWSIHSYIDDKPRDCLCYVKDE